MVKDLIIGSPIFKFIKLICNKTINNSDKNILIQSAKLNGQSLNRAFIYFKEFEAGLELALEMGDKPSTWGSKEVPLSYGNNN
ncbi:MAG: glycoside hydrolase family 92 protein [Cyclobacteriaceae bacterium]